MASTDGVRDLSKTNVEYFRDVLENRERIFYSFLAQVYKHPLKSLNKRCIKQGYMDLAKKMFVEEGLSLSKSFEEVVHKIVKDYMQGILKYKTFWNVRNFYSKLVEKAREFEGKSVGKEEEKLLLKFLSKIASTNHLPEKIDASFVASLMDTNPEIAKEFIKWLKKSDYYPFVKYVVDTKRREIALKRHNARK